MMQCTPSMMRMLMLNPDNTESLRSLKTVMLGGEALLPSLAKEALDLLPGRIMNMYGPTETTIWSAVREVDNRAEKVTIGDPIANTELYILDRNMQPMPIGVPGEIYIGGDGLARGYFGRPELTAEKFVPNPFSEEPGDRLYRTGDLACYLADGSINFLGRIDYQIKIRGYRIELGEIEAILEEHPGIQQSVVVAKEDKSGDKKLIAFIVPNSGGILESEELREQLRLRLPDYMIPAGFVLLDTLPLTANGKVDRKALLSVDGIPLSSKTEYVKPNNKLEQTIAVIWQQVLQLEKVGVNDNFFDIGGHSLLMAQVQSRLREALKKDLPLVRLLEHPTVGSLAKYLAQENGETLSIKENQNRAEKQKEAIRRQRQNFKRYRSNLKETIKLVT
jgi:hypothetical protein